MYLNKIKIENFRGIASLEIELERDITVLIGENNSGKTTVLEALNFGLKIIKSNQTCNFSEYDFYRNVESNSLLSSNPIVFTFNFLESKEHPWSDDITQTLNDVIVGSDYAAIKLRIVAQYDEGNDEITQNWYFLDGADEILGKPGKINDLRRLRPFFFQSALRAAKDEFHGKATYWSSFLKNKDIDEDTRKSLEEDLFTVNQKIVDAHSSFKNVTDEVKRISELVSVGKADSVSVDPAPSDVYKSLCYNTEVNLLTHSNIKIPIRSHGEGTQSLSVLLLFSAYLKTQLKEEFDKLAVPIIAIEEPEAHLHPNAIRAVWSLLENLPGQKIIATHSGDILSEVPVEKIRRLNRAATSTECTSIDSGLFEDEELRKFNHHVRRNRGELFFAKCWLLVEGETDVSVFVECADILKINLHRHGIRIVEYSQVDQKIFMKVADSLGIDWCLVADGDTEGKNYIKSAKKQLEGRDENNHIYKLSYENMDILLCCKGYGKSYEKGINKDKQVNITAKEGSFEYWKQVYQNLNKKFSKPAAALESILLMKEKGRDGVPDEIKNILIKLTERAGG